jgi:hypothetical protein
MWLSLNRLNRRVMSWPEPTPEGFCESDSMMTPAAGPSAPIRDSTAANSLFFFWSSSSK